MTTISSPSYGQDSPEAQPRPAQRWWLILGFLLLPLVLALLGWLLGSPGAELGQIAQGAVEALPFMLLAVLAYLGQRHILGVFGALLALLALLGGGGLMIMLISWVALAPHLQDGDFTLVDGGGAKLVWLGLGVLAAWVAAGVVAIPAVRQRLSRIIPLDPSSFVHTLMLSVVVGTTLLCFLPLIVLGEPPLLTLVRQTGMGESLNEGRSDTGMLLSTIYGLLWLVPATVFAVGYGQVRSLRQACERLGLVRPSLRQVAVGLGAAVILVLGVTALSAGVDWLWGALGWPKTDGEAFGSLLSFAISPVGAVVIGVTAGLGEELAVRGVLQAKAGILLSNLFFVSLHALQYSWDSLLVVFLIGMALGVLRKRTNTSTSAIAHGTYDFLLILASALQIPGLGE